MKRSLGLFVALVALAPLASAKVYQDYELDDDLWVDYYNGTYGWDVSGDEATVVWASMSLSGEVAIPATLDDEAGQSWRVTAIGEGAFYDCTRITSLVIPEGVRTIGMEAFVNCRSMTAVTLPTTLESIGQMAFEDCVKLKSLTIPAATTDIHDEAFDCCDVMRVTVDGENPAYKSVDGALLTKDGRKLLFATGGVKEYFVPETVTELGDFALGYTVQTVHFRGGVPTYTTWGFTFEPENIKQVTYTLAYADAWERAAPGGVWTVEHNTDDYEVTTRDLPAAPYGVWALQNSNAKYLTYANGVITGLTNKNVSGELVIPAEIDAPITAIAAGENGVFHNCPNLTKVTIPGTVKHLDAGTFYWCTRLAEVVLEEGVETIDPDAFDECPALATIRLPSTFKGVLGNFECPKAIYDIAADNPYYKVEGDLVLNKAAHPYGHPEGSVLFYYQGAAGADLTLPETVTRIDEYAFIGPNVGTLTLHKGVVAVGRLSNYGDTWDEGAGDALKNVSRVEVAEGNPALHAQDGALFRDDATEGTKLLRAPKDVTAYAVPEGVTVIGMGAFNGCALTKVTLPQTLRTVGLQAFHECAKLTEITFPKSLETMDAPFVNGGNAALRKITFQGNPPKATLPEIYAYEEDVWPASATGYYPISRRGLWESAMAADKDGSATKWNWLRMSPYEDVTGPAKDLAYENGVVTGVSSPTLSGALVIPDQWDGHAITAINADALAGCSRITAVTVPGSITTIGPRTFANMSGLAAVTLQEGVKAIKAGAFDGCAKLTKVVIPASCTAIDPLAFANCPDIAIEVAEGNEAYASVDGALLSKDGATLWLAPGNVTAYAVPETVTTIAAGAFAAGQAQGSRKLASVTIPAAVATIETGAFTGFDKVTVAPENAAYASTADGALFDKSMETLLHVPCSLRTYTVPDGVTAIDRAAFGGCASLTAVTLPYSLRSVGWDAFVNCPGLTRIDFLGEPPFVADGAVFGTCAAGTYPTLLTGKWMDALGGDETWNGLVLTAKAPTGAAGQLVYDSTNLDPVVTDLSGNPSGTLEIPQGVTAIAPGALDGATRLTAVTVPGSVATIQAGTFANLTGLATVTLQEGVTTIEAGAFEGCAKLAKVVIPASCTAIDPLAFANCPGIAIEVAEGNAAYASVEGALLSKDGETLWVAPGNVAVYSVPAGVRTIAEQAFRNNAALTSVTLPASVTTVGREAFAACAKLKTVAFLGEPPATVGENGFGPCTAGTYVNADWRAWVAAMGETGVWHGLTMTTTPCQITLNRAGNGTVSDGVTTVSSFPRTLSYQPGQTVTLTAKAANGYVFLGWSGEGFKADGATATFPSDAVAEITAHFVTQAVAETLEAVGVGPGGADTSLEEAIANGDVITKEQLQEMALGAPLIEVRDGKIAVGITLMQSDTLAPGAWKPVKPGSVSIEADGTLRALLDAEGDTRFYKFVVPQTP